MTAILAVERLPLMHWKTQDPFLFCAHHRDNFPKSAGKGEAYADLGVEPKLLRGRDLGSDFSGQDGFSMYHGEVVPGFPSHPHYGFETITVVREGLIDHFDSHGATARYGAGDAQWLTTGNGIQHSEMMPLVKSDSPNTAELFQIWLNLPKSKKKSKPFFAMAWGPQQPKVAYGEPGKQAHIRLVGGKILGLAGVPTPPDSYASDPTSEIVVATIKLEPGSSLKLPPASSSAINRTLYFFDGPGATVNGRTFRDKVTMIQVAADKEIELTGVPEGTSELLLLQGRPLGEPVVQQGPFVCNSREELMEVYSRFRTTQFGGWKWGRHDPAHPRSEKRFFEIDGKRVYAPDDAKDLEEKADSACTT